MHDSPLFDTPPSENVLALDTATNTGWALRKDGSLFSGTYNCQHDAKRESPGMRFVRFVGWLEAMVKENSVARVVYEAPHQRGGAATTVALGLVTHLMSTCARLGVEHQSVPTATLKKALTGKGNAKKEEMILKINGLTGLSVTSDDEADAIGLLFYAEGYRV